MACARDVDATRSTKVELTALNRDVREGLARRIAALFQGMPNDIAHWPDGEKKYEALRLMRAKQEYEAPNGLGEQAVRWIQQADRDLAFAAEYKPDPEAEAQGRLDPICDAIRNRNLLGRELVRRIGQWWSKVKAGVAWLIVAVVVGYLILRRLK